MPRLHVGSALALALTLACAAPAGAVEIDGFSPDPIVLSFPSPSPDASDEPSGLAASRTNPGVLWWENEEPRDGRGMVYAVDAEGVQRAYWFSLTGVDRAVGQHYDFEDAAVGPCDGPGSPSCLWIGDVGRISGDFPAEAKNTFWLYRIPEPDITALPEGAELPVTGCFPVTLPDGITRELQHPGGSNASYDIESLMVHPETGEVFVVTKGQNTAGLIRVLRHPGPMVPGVAAELQTVKTYQMPRAPGWSPADPRGSGMHLVTGADIHPDGRRFILRTYGWIWEFRGIDWADALASQNPVRLPRARGTSLDIQGEAVAYAADGTGYHSLGEASSTPDRTIASFVAAASDGGLPISTFAISATGAVEYGAVFDATASFDPDGAIAHYTWDFGDGSTAVTGAVAWHAYAGPGTYAVTLTVTDATGQQSASTIAAAIAQPTHEVDRIGGPAAEEPPAQTPAQTGGPALAPRRAGSRRPSSLCR